MSKYCSICGHCSGILGQYTDLQNDFESILLYFVANATLSQIWYCQISHAFWGYNLSAKNWDGVKKMTICKSANTVVFWANTMVFKTNTLVFWANTVLFGANTVLFWANTVVYWANTVVFVGKYSRVWGKIQIYLGQV